MIIYIGGSFQGQAEIAEKETGLKPQVVSREMALSAPAINDFHELLRGLAPAEARAFAEALIEKNPDTVIVADEVGMGVVPMEPEGRLWREAVGRAICLLAASAQSVTRVTCGIPVRIK